MKGDFPEPGSPLRIISTQVTQWDSRFGARWQQLVQRASAPGCVLLVRLGLLAHAVAGVVHRRPRGALAVVPLRVICRQEDLLGAIARAAARTTIDLTPI